MNKLNTVTLTKEEVEHIISIGIEIGQYDSLYSEDAVLGYVMTGNVRKLETIMGSLKEDT